ncbi:hypothetical protein AB6A40_006958 [Gnathostoma spinigerum]|uniref:Transcription factor AP-2 C-terminal domain-containing protein n=1 Tax=Gnathostoma spinigerum TaxID=75299 RepID=A0ABD6EJV7_9BILA
MRSRISSHNANTYVPAPVVGCHTMQPYFSNVSHTPLSSDLVDYANMNVNLFSTHQMTYGVPFASTSHYAWSCGGSEALNRLPSSADCVHNMLNERVINLDSQSGGALETSPESSPELNDSVHAYRKPSIAFGDQRGLSYVSAFSLSNAADLYASSLASYSDIFCTVPGRTSLLSSTTKYHVTIGEIQRRISPPECLNASLLGGILRKAKSKDGGKTLRDSLRQVGLTLPAGRRKATTVTAWTALVEEEALHMAKDFASLCEKDFPVRQVAEYACRKGIWHDDFERRRLMIENTRTVIKELAEIINSDRSPVCGGQPPIILAPAIQQRLTHFSMLTHGFGNLAFLAVLDTISTILEEMQRCCTTTVHSQRVTNMTTHNISNISQIYGGGVRK